MKFVIFVFIVELYLRMFYCKIIGGKIYLFIFIYITAQILSRFHFSLPLCRHGPPLVFNFSFVFSIHFIMKKFVIALYTTYI